MCPKESQYWKWINVLSDRENQVLQLMANGFSNQEIGQELFIEESTVKHHTSSVLHKLHARNRCHSVAIGIRNNLIQ